MAKERITKNFSDYDIRSSPIPGENLNRKLKIPVRLLKENQDMFDSYHGKNFKQPLVGRLYRELRLKHGINMPLNFDWETFITENRILFDCRPEVKEYTCVEEVRSFKIVGDDLSLSCIVSNPKYNRDKERRYKVS